jgi:hypothetical protein
LWFYQGSQYLLELHMRVSFSRKIMLRILSALAVSSILAVGFGCGFISCLHLKSSASAAIQREYLVQAGDASAAVRVEVIAALRAFQGGYIRRDPKELDSFMHRLFPEHDDVLVLGTDAGEWVRGQHAVTEFIGHDWEKWGDFRFAVDDSVVWSSGDVAWIASVGTVSAQGVDRPLRFSAILTRHGGDWFFRQLNFQWDDRTPRTKDLLQVSTYLRLFRLVVHQLRSAPYEPR